MLKRRWDPKSKKGKPKYLNEGLKFPYGEAKKELGIKSLILLPMQYRHLLRWDLLILKSEKRLNFKGYNLQAFGRWMKYGTNVFVPVKYEKRPTLAGFDRPEKRKGKFPATKNRSEFHYEKP